MPQQVNLGTTNQLYAMTAPIPFYQLFAWLNKQKVELNTKRQRYTSAPPQHLFPGVL